MPLEACTWLQSPISDEDSCKGHVYCVTFVATEYTSLDSNFESVNFSVNIQKYLQMYFVGEIILRAPLERFESI